MPWLFWVSIGWLLFFVLTLLLAFMVEPVYRGFYKAQRRVFDKEAEDNVNMWFDRLMSFPIKIFWSPFNAIAHIPYGIGFLFGKLKILFGKTS